MLNNFFDKIYCINLDRRTDRWAESEAEFAKWGITVERVSAIDGKDLTQNSTSINNGAYALLLTVQKLVTEALEAGYEKILILEDDVEFTNELNHFANEVQYLPADWIMLYFGGNHHGMDKVRMNSYFKRLIHTYTTHAVGMNREGMQSIINILNQKIQQIDVLYADIQKGNRVYCFNKLMATQRPSFSDIENVVVNYKNVIK